MFAQERSVLAGNLDMLDGGSPGLLRRLAESGCGAATIEYSIVGGENAAGNPCLRVAARGSMTLQCQRCMQALVVPLDVASDLELALSLEAAEAADDGVDRVVAAQRMDVAALVEDELLLGLPMVPMHERCAAPAKDDESRPSAFAALEKLRSGKA